MYDCLIHSIVRGDGRKVLIMVHGSNAIWIAPLIMEYDCLTHSIIWGEGGKVLTIMDIMLRVATLMIV